METVENEGLYKTTRGSTNRIRTYDGQFPLLSVCLRSSNNLSSVEVLQDLSVVKIGKALRQLQVEKTTESNTEIGYIHVVWSVELENNRRVITISNAISLISPKCAIPIEFGVLQQTPHHTKESEGKNLIVVKSIGISTPSKGFCLPLWIDLCFQSAEIYIRPFTKCNLYEWCSSSILQFSRLNSKDSSSLSLTPDIWTWTIRDSNCSVVCEPSKKGAQDDELRFPAFLSFDCIDKRLMSTKKQLKKGALTENDVEISNGYQIICLNFFSPLSIRNILPTSVDWEVSNCITTATSKVIKLVDGSSIRKNQNRETMTEALSPGECNFMIPSGGGEEVLSCNIFTMTIQVRFRCTFDQSWSSWVLLNPESSEYDNLNENNDQDTSKRYPRHVNVQCRNKNGTPLTLGVKIVPKHFLSSQPTQEGVTNAEMQKGFDMILYNELWMVNLTSLPIIFGAPSTQVYSRETDSPPTDDSTNKIAAESALLELTSILEFGDKGHTFSVDNDDNYHDGEICILPQQQDDHVIEEVFEYVEIEGGSVSRRWWASENHNNERPSPSLQDSIDGFYWIDKSWRIDVSGDCKAIQGGWESCSNLVGGKTKYFSGQRKFDPHHRFRRRRWYRKRSLTTGRKNADGQVNRTNTAELLKIQHQIGVDLKSIAFHQPIVDAEAIIMKNVNSKLNNSNQKAQTDQHVASFLDIASEQVEKDCLKIYFKLRDGRWSCPAIIPTNGAGHGIVKICSSRWPEITAKLSPKKRRSREAEFVSNSLAAGTDGLSNIKFSKGSLSPNCYELSYHISILDGQWGEHSRILMLHPRFILRNDSSLWHMEVKQVGTPDNTLVRVKTGMCVPFYWADVCLPELICVRPVRLDSRGKVLRYYRWSGGFDICNLGLIPLRIREEKNKKNPQQNRISERPKDDRSRVRVIRSQIEIRSSTGGTGVTVSFVEERANGENSLYRIENHSPFPLWIAQDGVLANPQYNKMMNSSESSSQEYMEQSEYHGDIVLPHEKVSFGLDVPFRQGKYAGRKAATLVELLTIRIGLAPLSMRDGIETMTVVGLGYVGTAVRLQPSKLRSFLNENLVQELMQVRVQGVVCADGPTRVLKLILVQCSLSASGVLRNSVMTHTSARPVVNPNRNDLLEHELNVAATKATLLLKQNKIPQSKDCGYQEDIGSPMSSNGKETEEAPAKLNCFYSFTACFSGFVVSFIDAVPSEIAVASIRKLDAMGKWDLNRASEATTAISIGWMQIDNHCPNAPFPVALSPVVNEEESYDDDTCRQNPFLSIGIVFAPKHKSNIMCVKGVTISPKDVTFCTDLAFIMRMQHFVSSLQLYLDHYKGKKDLLDQETPNTWLFPDLVDVFKKKTGSNGINIASQKLYFDGLTILPFNIKLSVAPAVALSTAQAALEGPQAAAIHAAVRKGDVLIGDDADGVLAVKIGSKNRTALSVIRGIFKSILVDSLLRCDGASMNFSGVGVRNHIATTSQLKTFLGHHYLSLLKSNVPALLGSLAAFGNPVGLIRGFGDGVTDFVSEPIKGFKRTFEDLDPTHAVTGVARGTGSLARHTVGGIVDSASLLTETFSKNMAVLTLDRKYAQRRDRFKTLPGTSTTFVQGVESGVEKLLRGVAEGVIGVVRYPLRGAEKRGVEGLAKGIGKGLLGLIVKPVIGLSDAATDVMVGMKGALDGAGSGGSSRGTTPTQIRPRRAFYGRDRSLRPYEIVDAISAAIMMRTRLAGENYLSHVDMGGRVAILGVRRFLLLGDDGEAELLIKLKNIKHVELRQVPKQDEKKMEWGVLIFLKNRKYGNEVEVITTNDRDVAIDLCSKIKQGVNLAGSR